MTTPMEVTDGSTQEAKATPEQKLLEVRDPLGSRREPS
jgi:hypothetical protein